MTRVQHWWMEIVLLVQRCCLPTEARLLPADCAAASPSPSPPSLPSSQSPLHTRAHMGAHIHTLMGYAFWNHYRKYKGLQRIRKIADSLFSWAISNAKYNRIKLQNEYYFFTSFYSHNYSTFATVHNFLSPWEINTIYRTEESPQKLFFLYTCSFCYKNQSYQTWW